MSDVMSVFGSAALSLPHDQIIGLWCNIDRLRAVQSVVVANGVRMAMGKPVDKALLSALAESPEQAREMILDAEIARREAEALARRGWTA